MLYRRILKKKKRNLPIAYIPETKLYSGFQTLHYWTEGAQRVDKSVVDV